MRMCANHPDEFAVAYCRTCGKPLCDLCKIETMGAIYCVEHGPIPKSADTSAPPPPLYDAAAFTGSTAGSAPGSYPGAFQNAPGGVYPQTPYVASPYTAPPVSGVSPFLALMLGMIPGVGAIYNGQYAKGLIHAVVFGLLISIISSHDGPATPLEPLLGILIAVWWFYMVLEAYHTARKRRDGIAVDEFSSILHFKGTGTGFPVGAVVLIGLGSLLLLNTSGLISIWNLVRYWPMVLIAVGIYLLYVRVDRRADASISQPALTRDLGTRELGDERR